MPTETDLERRIRDALEYQADQAPHPATIRVPDQRRAPRRTMGLVVAAAAIVVLAGIAVPVTTHLLARPAAPKASAASGGPAIPISTAHQPTPETLWYRPSWLPDGYVALSRTVEPTRVDQVWVPKSNESEVIRIGLSAIKLDDPATRQRYQQWMAQADGRTTVNGQPAVFIAVHNSPKDAWARLVWMASPDVALDLDVTIPGTDSGIAQQVANSISADAVAPQSVNPVTVGYVPAGKTQNSYTVAGFSPTSWWYEEDFSVPGDQTGVQTLAVSWEPKRPTTPPYTVGMPLDGQWLAVSLTGASQAELNQILHSVTLNTNFDRSWMGTS